jgi:hypothetical protein
VLVAALPDLRDRAGGRHGAGQQHPYHLHGMEMEEDRSHKSPSCIICKIIRLICA